MAKSGSSNKKVGYKKPPQNSRFKVGQSGNPKGRPKGSKNLIDTLNKEMESRVDVTENGRKKRITKREAIAKVLINKAASGDPRAAPLVLKAAGNGRPLREEDEPHDTAMPREDEFVMADIIRRIRLMDAPGTTGSAPEQPLPPSVSDPT